MRLRVRVISGMNGTFSHHKISVIDFERSETITLKFTDKKYQTTHSH